MRRLKLIFNAMKHRALISAIFFPHLLMMSACTRSPCFNSETMAPAVVIEKCEAANIPFSKGVIRISGKIIGHYDMRDSRRHMHSEIKLIKVDSFIGDVSGIKLTDLSKIDVSSERFASRSIDVYIRSFISDEVFQKITDGDQEILAMNKFQDWHDGNYVELIFIKFKNCLIIHAHTAK